MIRLAFYGKGGIGKSTTVSNLSVYWAGRGLRVLQIGCDPKADSTIALRRGERIPTVMDKVRSGTPFALEDVITLWHPASDRAPSGGCVICAEAGGPLPGMGCAGRGIITALDKLGELGLYDTYEPDVVLYEEGSLEGGADVVWNTTRKGLFGIAQNNREIIDAEVVQEGDTTLLDKLMEGNTVAEQNQYFNIVEP